jgi:hypothetical protein
VLRIAARRIGITRHLPASIDYGIEPARSES